MGISLYSILRNLKRSHALTVFYYGDTFLFYLVTYITLSVSPLYSDLNGKNSEYIYNTFLSSKICHNFILPDFITQLILYLLFWRNRPPPPPSGPRPPHSRGFQITQNDAPQSVGLLWMNDQLVAETSTWQHTVQHPQHTDIHAPDWIRTHNISRRAAADPRLRPRGHWDRHHPDNTW